MADKPFPTSEAELNLFLQNFVAKLGSYSVTLGLTAGEVTALENDAANFNYIITAATQVNDSKDAFFSFKSQLTDGDPSTTPIVPPVFPIIATPEAANPGIKKRTRALVQRIKTSPGYTEQIGEDLGLVDSGTGEIDLGPDGLTAALNVVAISDNRVSITFSRQGMDAMRVEMKRKNDVNWSLAGIYTSSPAIHDEASVPPGDPESRQYRGWLLLKNEQVGNPSPIYTIVTTP